MREELRAAIFELDASTSSRNASAREFRAAMLGKDAADAASRVMTLGEIHRIGWARQHYTRAGERCGKAERSANALALVFARDSLAAD